MVGFPTILYHHLLLQTARQKEYICSPQLVYLAGVDPQWALMFAGLALGILGASSGGPPSFVTRLHIQGGKSKIIMIPVNLPLLQTDNFRHPGFVIK
ncbi:MAG TPA: hypothetical protein VM912_09605 [Terriglobales bacterium]|nr:hypothetical protein [Terriglobales bacterium]